MRSLATRNMFTSDGAGREELTAETEDAVVARLEARGILPCKMEAHEYDMEFEKELQALIEEAEDDYGEVMFDYYAGQKEDEEYWMNLPGGEADYLY